MLAAKQDEGQSPSRKRTFDEQKLSDQDEGSSPRGRSPTPSTTRDNESQAPARCEPDPAIVHSPPEADVRVRTSNTDYYKPHKPYPQSMDTDSPSSYPKHIMVPAPHRASSYQKEPPMLEPQHGTQYQQHPDHYGGRDHHSSTETPPSHISRHIVTPNINTPERMPAMHHSYHSPPPYRPSSSSYYPEHADSYGNRPYYGGSSAHYNSPPGPHDVDQGHNYYYYGGPHGGPPGGYRPYPGDRHHEHYSEPPRDHQHGGYHGGVGENVQMRSKVWACDYCSDAKFATFEEATAHEELCRQRHEGVKRSKGAPTYPPTSPHSPGEGMPRTGGLGTLYHASQEVQHHPPRSPHRDHPAWIAPPPSRGGPPGSAEHQKYTLSPRYGRSFRGPGGYGHDEPYIHVTSPGNKENRNSKRMLLAMPSDTDSLSDRQCYVRSHFVEVFTATEKDVSARHSKGAQRLTVGQVGIRCIHCARNRPKDRAERAVCYPSSVSRIYQTVADMQRFHFEQCDQIPDETRRMYKSLKTTRPRGVGSPQTYWIQSAKLIGLTDTPDGIRFGNGQELDAEPV